MSAKNSGLDRAADELAKGRAWRAKEILSGKLRDAPYDADLFKAYADVLLAMRDEREASSDRAFRAAAPSRSSIFDTGPIQDQRWTTAGEPVF